MKQQFPKNINLVVHVEPDGGFWAEFPGLPGCYTQGDSLGELSSQVQDVLLTYFDVPRKEAKKFRPNITLSAKGKINLQPVKA